MDDVSQQVVVLEAVVGVHLLVVDCQGAALDTAFLVNGPHLLAHRPTGRQH